MRQIFKDFDFENFWDNNEYAQENYISETLTDELLKEVQAELPYKIPSSYIEFMQCQNGGIPVNTCYPTNTPNGWADDHIAIDMISGISKNELNSLAGEYGSQYMIEDIDYPDIGIYFAGSPCGHAMIALDYSECGKDGEPCVVYVEQDDDNKIFLAKDFETFIKGLKHEDEFIDDK